MKNLSLLILSVFFTITSFAQKYATDDGFVVEGYDVTEYFNNKAVEGKDKFVANYDGVKFKFVSQQNLDKFKANPTKYIPQYGGFCAYALADRTARKNPDPETFEIRDGKLFLFYNSWGWNTKNKWLDKGPENMKPKADAAWLKIKDEKDDSFF